MAKIPNIVCTGMLDTKKEEIQYLAEKVREFGGRPVILDLSLGNEADWADIKVGEVLAIIGKAKEEMFAVSRSAAVEMIGPAAHAKILEMYKDGLVDGIISWAGSMGTSAVTYAMRALPLGVPKVMLCTGAARDVSKWLGVKDIYITNPISEKGINRITRKTVRNAVAAVVAMGKLEDEDVQDNPLAAVTLYGTTTPTAIDCAGHLDKKGFDTLYFHQTGIGALMEELIRQGQIKFVLDITPGEISRHNYFPSSKLAPGERFTAAFDTGVPNISAPGGLDQIPTSIAPQNIPKDMLEGYVSGERISYRDTKKPYAHNMSTTIVAPTLQENRDMALEIIRKLNTAKG
ncbi:MAG: Tm-1-like ATP-binding domain-containing protein, partial [Christensenellales bacterium]